jgi:hypothetical protein
VKRQGLLPMRFGLHNFSHKYQRRDFGAASSERPAYRTDLARVVSKPPNGLRAYGVLAFNPTRSNTPVLPAINLDSFSSTPEAQRRSPWLDHGTTMLPGRKEMRITTSGMVRLMAYIYLYDHWLGTFYVSLNIADNSKQPADSPSSNREDVDHSGNCSLH